MQTKQTETAGKRCFEKKGIRRSQAQEMRGGVRETPAGWMREDEEEAVNFTLKLWGRTSACDEH